MQTAKIDLDDGGERELVLHLLRFSEVYNICNGETEMFIAIVMFAFHLCLFGLCNVLRGSILMDVFFFPSKLSGC